jgi:hypothetical protein
MYPCHSTVFISSSLVYWLGYGPLKAESGVQFPDEEITFLPETFAKQDTVVRPTPLGTVFFEISNFRFLLSPTIVFAEK